MKSSFSLSILSVIFLLSFISASLLYFYMDPERNLPVAYATMGVALTLCCTSLLSLVLYFFKRIYYRGMVDASILHTSIRQGLLVTLGLVGVVAFERLGILTWKTGGLLFLIAFLFELMIESMSDD